jgi:hypothetical protein
MRQNWVGKNQWLSWQEWQGSNLRPPVLETARVCTAVLWSVRLCRIFSPTLPSAMLSSSSGYLLSHPVWVQTWVPLKAPTVSDLFGRSSPRSPPATTERTDMLHAETVPRRRVRQMTPARL